MADKKISELNVASAVFDTDDLPLVQSAETKQVNASVVKTYVNTAPTITGGAINSTSVGATTPAAGSFTTLTANSPSVISVNSASDALRITQTGAGNAFVVEDSTNPDSTPFVINNGGQVLVGGTTAISSPNYNGTQIPQHLQSQSAVAYDGLSLQNYVAGTGSSGITFAHSRSGALGTQTILNDADITGAIVFAGSDGTNFIRNAQIEARVDGTPGTNDMPGRLVFSTTADGASSPTERMRIDSTGAVGIGGTPGAVYTLRLAKNITGSTGIYNVANEGTIQSDVTGTASLYYTAGKTAAASFTLTNLRHYTADQGTFGAGSTVTNQFGFFANFTLTGATNNYGFYSNIASGSNRYNFYANGTADNYFAGAIKGNTSIAGGYTAHSAGTTAMVLGSNKVVKVTPNATATFTTTVAPAGATAKIIIVTSGTTSYTITFGTGFLATGTLATGTVTAKTFVISFVSDGTTMIESSRTIAM